MAIFHVSCMNSSGAVKVVRIHATTRQEALKIVSSRDLQPTQIVEVSPNTPHPVNRDDD